MEIEENNFLKSEILEPEIINNLNNLYKSNNIPNIIFHGNNLSGKKNILEYFLTLIYKDYTNIKKYVLLINCSHGKGNIKFIRENLKYFANSIIISKEHNFFKSVVLMNADKLTIDAQSALRRCIEIYNHSTRFFIIVEDKNKILKPILSRFSHIYCKNNPKFVKNNELYESIDYTNKKIMNLNKYIDLQLINNISEDNKLLFISNLTNDLYNNGFSGNMLMTFIKNKLPDNCNKYKFLHLMDVYKFELKNEKLIILFCLNFIYFRNNIDLENIANI